MPSAGVATDASQFSEALGWAWATVHTMVCTSGIGAAGLRHGEDYVVVESDEQRSWSSTAPVEGQLESVLKSASARSISALGISALAPGRKSKRADFASLGVTLTTTSATTECRARASA